MGKKKSNKGRKKDVDTQPHDHSGSSSNSSGDMIWVDPARVRFQHSRIRPVFSGCGRSVVGTLDEIRQGRLSPSNLPPILVIVGRPRSSQTATTIICNDDEDDVSGRRGGRRRKQQPRKAESQPWYFSLNNRRLWVLKRCREEGLLVATENKILVRLREPKSQQELERYCVENCALEAKIIPDPSSCRDKNKKHDNNASNNRQDEGTTKTTVVDISEEEKKTDSEDAISDQHDIDDRQSENEDDDDDGGDDDVDGDEDDCRAPSNRFGALLI